MTHWNEAKKRTGRTTRMLNEAIRLADEGRAVYVIAASHDHARRLSALLPEDCGVKVEPPDAKGNLDWQATRLQGGHPNCVVLVDHYAIEKHYWCLLDMWHRFDAPGGES